MSSYKKSLSITLVYTLAGSMVLAILASYFSSKGYDDAWISNVFGIFPFVLIAVSAFFGDLSDRVGRSWLLFLAFGGTIIAYGLYFLASPWSIVFGRVLDAVCFGAVAVLLISKIEDSVDDKSRGRKTGFALTLDYAVRLLGPVIAGVLADVYFGLPFFASMTILFFLALFLRKAKIRSSKNMKPHPIKQLKWFFSRKNLRPMLFLGPAIHAGEPAFVVFIPLYITNTLQLSYTDVGFALGVFGAGHVFQFFFGMLSDKYGPRKLIFAGTFVKSVMLVYIGLFVSSYTHLLVSLFIMGVGSAMWNVSAWSFMSSIAERANREGAVVGSYLSVAKVGSAIAFPLAAWLVATGSYMLVFIVLGTIGVFASLWSGAVFGYQQVTGS